MSQTLLDFLKIHKKRFRFTTLWKMLEIKITNYQFPYECDLMLLEV